jgi:hypothetical protein
LRELVSKYLQEDSAARTRLELRVRWMGPRDAHPRPFLFAGAVLGGTGLSSPDREMKGGDGAERSGRDDPRHGSPKRVRLH